MAMCYVCHERYGEAPTADQVKEFNRVSCHFFEQHPGEIIGEQCIFNIFSILEWIVGDDRGIGLINFIV